MAGDPESRKLEEMAARIRVAGPTPAPAKEAPLAASQSFKASRVGFDFIGTVMVCIGLGWVADHFLGTGPWGILAMMIVGFAAGMYNVTRALNVKK
jgi:ATP synthase protein I